MPSSKHHALTVSGFVQAQGYSKQLTTQNDRTRALELMLAQCTSTWSERDVQVCLADLQLVTLPA